MNITVLSQPGCQPCIATKRKMDQLGLVHEYRDVTTDPEAMSLAQASGHSSTPIVLVQRSGDDMETWSGYKPDKIQELAA